MKRTIVALVGAGLLTSCNMAMVDTVFNYDKAIIKFQDGSVKTVDIYKWCDFADGDQMQIYSKDGKVYLVHSVNVTLIREAR